MTITGIPCLPSDDLASACKFYPLKISVPHHQLRHFVSLADQDRLYYVNNYDIFCLNLRTRRRTLLATVPFEARCLAAGHGWIGIGGEQKGDCAFVRVEIQDGEPRCFGHDVVVDVLGGEIVNAMSIHLLRHQDVVEPVVVISNNDRTVKLYSLAQRKVLTTLKHAKPMNYATLSPDTEILAAVGDSEHVFFYQRRPLPQQPSNGTSPAFPQYEWIRFRIGVVPMGEMDHDDHGFAVTFSPNGRLCAASSRGGIITVFDMDILRSEPPQAAHSILCSFNSSRTGLWGCVRSMAFSPDPWDLLAWAEDHGRIGIADVRQLFLRRQILKMDQAEAEVLDVEDATPVEVRGLSLKEKLTQQSQRTQRIQRNSRRNTLEGGSRIEQLMAENRAEQRRQSRADLNTHHNNMDLDPRERSVLEALETTMDDVEQFNTQPYSVNYTSSPRVRASAQSLEYRRDVDIQLLNPGVRQSGSRAQPPRRRSSVILSESRSSRGLVPPEASRMTMTASPGPMTEPEDDVHPPMAPNDFHSAMSTNDFHPPMSTNDLTPTRGGSAVQPLPYSIPSSEPWRRIQAALEAAREQDNTPFLSHVSSSLSQIEAELQSERQLASRLEGQLSDSSSWMRLNRGLDISERADELSRDQRHEMLTGRHPPYAPPPLETADRLDPSVESLIQQALETGRSPNLETPELRLEEFQRQLLELETQRDQTRIRHTQRVDDTNSSGQSSALPTTRTPEDISALLHRHEENNRARFERELQRQSEELHSNLELTSPTRESPSQRGETLDRHSRLLEARVAARNARANIDGRRAAIRRAEAVLNADRTGIRSTELAGRVTENDMHLARMMLMSGTRAAMDANGNWEAGAALRRVLGREAPVADGHSAVEEIIREMGHGTAGICWSPNGNALYAGSEEGIFEFKVNIKDRMTFPLMQMR